MTGRHLPAVRFALLSVAVLAAAALVAMAPSFALMAAPVMALTLAVLFGRVPGEEMFVERIRRARSRARRPVGFTARSPRGLATVVRRAGLLRSFALAMRPPPARAFSLS